MPDYLSPRFGLPLLAVGQAAKELAHNEALLLLEALCAPVFETEQANPPPDAERVAGRMWIVGPEPEGDWTDAQAGALALWTEGGWRFIRPERGFVAARAGDGLRLRFDGTRWSATAAPPVPSGGDTVDIEARTALAGLCDALRRAGLLA